MPEKRGNGNRSQKAESWKPTRWSGPTRATRTESAPCSPLSAPHFISYTDEAHRAHSVREKGMSRLTNLPEMHCYDTSGPPCGQRQYRRS